MSKMGGYGGKMALMLMLAMAMDEQIRHPNGVYHPPKPTDKICPICETIHNKCSIFCSKECFIKAKKKQKSERKKALKGLHRLHGKEHSYER